MSEDFERMRRAASAMELAAEAIAHAGPGRKVDPLKVVRKAAADEGAGATAREAFMAAFSADEVTVELRVEAGSNADFVTALRSGAMGLRRRADFLESPDNLAGILAGRMERGFAYLPTSLLRSLYGFGRSVAQVKRGERASKDVEPEALRLMEEAARWAETTNDRRVADDVLCPVRPEPPF